MDNVTHTLMGLGLANAFFKKRFGPEAVPILAWASNLPDIDAIVVLANEPSAILLRRTFGHSLFLLPVWCLALAWLFKRRCPDKSFAGVLGLVALGAGTHLFFDLVNSFGVRLLWPFSPWRPELAAVFIVDLALLALLSAPYVLRRLSKLDEEGLFRFSLAGAAGYLVFCLVSRATAGVLLARQAESLRPDFAYVFPEALGPHRWRGVLRTGGAYRLYLISPLRGTVEERVLIETDPDFLVAKRAAATGLGQGLLAFFKAPVWSVYKEGTVGLRDLRFDSLVLRRGHPFQYLFRSGPADGIEVFHGGRWRPL